MGEFQCECCKMHRCEAKSPGVGYICEPCLGHFHDEHYVAATAHGAEGDRLLAVARAAAALDEERQMVLKLARSTEPDARIFRELHAALSALGGIGE
jgi:hypothetical protein